MYKDYWKTELALFLKAQDEWNDDWIYDDWSHQSKELKRQRRIRDRNRMIARGRNIDLKNQDRWFGSDPYRYERAEMYGRYYHNHLKICSCDVCGNPRRGGWTSGRFKLTMQERRARHDEKEQLEILKWQEKD